MHRSVIERKRLGHRLDAEVDLPVYPIRVVAEHFGVSGQTLRLYESKGLWFRKEVCRLVRQPFRRFGRATCRARRSPIRPR